MKPTNFSAKHMHEDLHAATCSVPGAEAIVDLIYEELRIFALWDMINMSGIR
jgi:hypothetical protein